METNEERRRRKLAKLCSTHGKDQVAEAAAVSPEYLDQILKGVLLPKKQDGTRSRRALGEDSARKIEAAYGLPVGWMDNDWPFVLVSQSRWEALDATGQGYVQSAMNRAIDEIEQASSQNLGNGAWT